MHSGTFLNILKYSRMIWALFKGRISTLGTHRHTDIRTCRAASLQLKILDLLKAKTQSILGQITNPGTFFESRELSFGTSFVELIETRI